MNGIDLHYLDKLDEAQRDFVLSASGKRFFDEFICQKGYHAYLIGNTGSGKTQKGYFLVNWLKHTENQIWVSTGKNNEILPLLCMGKPVRIIVPKGCNIKITHRGEPIENHPEVIQVRTPGDSWWAVRTEFDKSRNKAPTLNIFEFRNAFWSAKARSSWMAGLFETLASWTRLDQMPAIFPFTLYIDEAQWVLAGTRVSTDQSRVKTSEIVTENALEIRGAGGRLVFFAQDYKNITPASRENMLVTILCRGAMVDRDENPILALHCHGRLGRLPSKFKPWQGKIVYPDGESAPKYVPWNFPLFPLKEEDRKWIRGLKVEYEGFHDRQPEQAETEEECIPELGRFSALAIPPEKKGETISRWGAFTNGDDD